MVHSCEFQWFGQKWKCVRGPVPGDDGGECDAVARLITIDDKFDLEDFLNTLHHELFEGASYMTGCTFTRDFPDEQDMFLMTHTQMDIISSGIRGAYEEVKKKMVPENYKQRASKTKKPSESKNKAKRSARR